MPAMLEDPARPPIYRTSGAPPYPTPNNPEIPSTIVPRQVTLRDRITIATLLPFSTATTVPPRLLSYLCQQFNIEIEKGDTYPMITTMPQETFNAYWFQNFGAIMILGAVEGQGYVEEMWRMEEQGVKWEEIALGSFYVKPNYPGRSSHVCNGGFLVTEAARNKGVGRLMGEGYLEWAPKLGYTYSVFNLVYETNVASCRIWDALGFKRIGRIKGCGNLRSSPDGLVDAIIYGRDLDPEGEDYVSEERFDKIRFYLKHGKYPNGADRAEKSRLRSAATHYKLLPPEEGREGGAGEDEERLMLRDKEVISDPQRQYEIARRVHTQGQHGGINKTTATIAEKYHWVRIKETVSLVIKNCENCKDATPKAPPQTQSNSKKQDKRTTNAPTAADTTMIDRLMNFDNRPQPQGQQNRSHRPQLETHDTQQLTSADPSEAGPNPGSIGPAPVAHMHFHDLSQYSGIPLDPQIMQSSQLHHQQRQHQQRSPQQAFQPQSPFRTTGYQQPPSSHAFPAGDPHYQQHSHAASHANPQKLSDAADLVHAFESSTTVPTPTFSRTTRQGAAAAAAASQQIPLDAPAVDRRHIVGTSNGNSRKSTRSSNTTAAHVNVSKSGNLSLDHRQGNDVLGDNDIDMTGTTQVAQATPQTSALINEDGGSGGSGGDDMRMATDRHITMGDDPMATR